MTEHFLHGVEIVEIDEGPRPITTVRSSVLGLVGTAPDAEAAVAAVLVTGVVADDNDLTWTAATAGLAGNDIRIYLKDPGSASQTLSVSVSGTVITVSLSTDGTGEITSTATAVLTAVMASTAASALVTVIGTGFSAGIVTPTVKQLPLSGGLDAALPLDTPVLVTRRTEAARFGDTGTIPSALDAIWDQGGAWVVVVRVTQGPILRDDTTITNLIGDGADGTGVHALVGAESEIGRAHV